MATKKKAGGYVGGAYKRKTYERAAANLSVPFKNQPNSMDPISVFEDAQTSPQVSTEPTLVRRERRGRPRKSFATQKKAPSSRPVRESDPVIENSDAGENTKIPNNLHVFETRLNTVEENVKNVVSTLEQGMAKIEAVIAKSAEKQTESPSLADMNEDLKCSNYKAKYVLSQEKNGELHSENRDMRTKLEAALARVEGYEKGQQVLCETIGKLKDACYVSCLAKTIESALGGPSLGGFINNDAPSPKAPSTASPSEGRNAAKARRKSVVGEAAPAAARRKF